MYVTCQMCFKCVSVKHIIHVKNLTGTLEKNNTKHSYVYVVVIQSKLFIFLFFHIYI